MPSVANVAALTSINQSVDREQVRRFMTVELADLLFNGSIKSLVLSLVRQDGVTPEELAEVRQLIEEMESQR